MQLKNIKII